MEMKDIVKMNCASFRIERIEFLDEQELLVQLLQHYCLSCGYSDSTHQGKL